MYSTFSRTYLYKSRKVSINFLNTDNKCPEKICSDTFSEKELGVKKPAEKSPQKAVSDLDSAGRRAVIKDSPQGESEKRTAEKPTPITTKELIGYAWQISRGMSYLVEMKVRRGALPRNDGSGDLIHMKLWQEHPNMG